ncbi:MAG: Asp-tRNA(Asn)/Glu-tRNA(Gln) amidotransferase subunit GatC [Acidobacteria bacterium]|nr:Asp-tRNA(Asn)/Glu-tRNA(Gln) amidotransferase subunit GatC [Acidobacteriota bacterium]
MPITRAEVEKIALLANLELTEAEKLSFSAELADIVDYIDQLNELDTTAITPWTQRSAGEVTESSAARPDQVLPGLGQDLALEGAPDQEDGHFTVPRVIGG